MGLFFRGVGVGVGSTEDAVSPRFRFLRGVVVGVGGSAFRWVIALRVMGLSGSGDGIRFVEDTPSAAAVMLAASLDCENPLQAVSCQGSA